MPTTPLNLNGWAYCSPYTLCRPLTGWRSWPIVQRWFPDLEIDGKLYWNLEKEERATDVYPGSPAGITDIIFLVAGEEMELTDAELEDADDFAWERINFWYDKDPEETK